MLRSLLAPALLLVLFPTLAPVAHGVEPAAFPRATIDLGTVVGDLERSVRFYREAIGFRELKGFDVDKWLGRWLQAPMPALAGQAPAELLDMPSGQAVVMLVRDGLRLLLARDRVIEAWLREQVVPAAEALAADPSRGRSIEEVRAHLAKKRSTVTRR